MTGTKMISKELYHKLGMLGYRKHARRLDVSFARSQTRLISHYLASCVGNYTLESAECDCSKGHRSRSVNFAANATLAASYRGAAANFGEQHSTSISVARSPTPPQRQQPPTTIDRVQRSSVHGKCLGMQSFSSSSGILTSSQVAPAYGERDTLHSKDDVSTEEEVYPLIHLPPNQHIVVMVGRSDYKPDEKRLIELTPSDDVSKYLFKSFELRWMDWCNKRPEKNDMLSICNYTAERNL